MLADRLAGVDLSDKGIIIAKMRDEPRPEDNTTSKSDQSPAEMQPSARSADIPAAAEPPTAEEHHRAAERHYWKRQIRVGRWYNGITLLAALVGIIGLFFVYRGLVATRRAADAANEANRITREHNVITSRPWIPPNLVVSEITFDENSQANIIVDFNFKNTGLTPATNVWPDMTVNVDWQHPLEYAKIQHDLCSENRNASTLGNTVFPGQEVPFHLVLLVSGEDIKKLPIGDDRRQVFIPTIIGCINYRFALTNNIGHSGFIYRVGRNDPTRLNAWSPLYVQKGNIPLAEIKLEPWPEGNGFFTD
jgi:hypothetical protein